MNVDGRNFVHRNSRTPRFFEPHLITFCLDWHWIRIMDSCGFKVTCGGGEVSCDCLELVFIQLHYSKQQDTRGKIFQPILIKYWHRACGSMPRKVEGSFQGRLVVELLLLVIASAVNSCILQGLALRPPAEEQKSVNTWLPPSPTPNLFWYVFLGSSLW